MECAAEERKRRALNDKGIVVAGGHEVASGSDYSVHTRTSSTGDSTLV